MKHKRFANVARRLYCEPWLILPTMHATMRSIFRAHLERSGILDFDMPDDEETVVSTYETVDGVAVVPVYGVIDKDISGMARISGACDVRDVEAMLTDAATREDIMAIVLDIDSPGGGVEGVPELSARVASIQKPVFAFTDGLMCSAAYWIAAGAKAIYATPSSTIGSVGVYMAMLDESGAYEKEGLKMDVIKPDASTLKAAGLEGTSLTDEQRANFKEQVTYLLDAFKASITARRKVKDEDMRGQTYFGAQAVDNGMIDAIGDLNKCIQDAHAWAGRSAA